MDSEIFNRWNEKKKKTNALKNSPHFSVGEIWWAQIGHNIFTEVAGKGDDFLRPIIVLQKVYGNACMAIPLTSQMRKGDDYFYFHDSKQARQCALMAQIRYLDGKRLKYIQSMITNEDFVRLKEAFQTLINKNPA